jgi:hypothetical membrane protein
MRQYISELAMPKCPYAKIVNLSFILAGLLTIVFSVALYGGLPKSGISWVAPLLLALHGLSNVMSGVFPLDMKGISARIHSLISEFSANSSLFIPAIIWLSTRNEAHWSGLSVFSLVMQFIVLAAFVAYTYVVETRKKPSSKAVVGLFQRLYLGVFYIWFLGLVIGIIRGL